MKTYITTDTHFNHKMLIDKGYRPSDFEDRIWENISKSIKDNDILIHLGDICIGNDEAVHERLMNIKCKKILVRGNHDNKSDNWYYEHGWDFVCKEFMLKKFGKYILFRHEPIEIREGVDIQLHGHTHGNAHRDDEHCSFYDEGYHIELALENNGYNLYELTDKLIN